MERKILLVDDHALYRGAIRQLIDLLYKDNTFFEAGSLKEALAEAEAHPDCDLVIYDLGLPDTKGLEGLIAFREAFPNLSVVVLSSDDTPDTIRQSLDAGASGFIPKSLSNEQLADSLEYVLTGGVYVADQILNTDIAEAIKPAHPLTPHQLEVLVLLAEGHADEDIAAQLKEEDETIRAEVIEILHALDVQSRIKAAVKAERMGLLNRNG